MQLPGWKVDVQISDLGDVQLLVAYGKIGFLRRMFARADPRAFTGLLRALGSILKQAPFRETRWYTRQEWEGEFEPLGRSNSPGA